MSSTNHEYRFLKACRREPVDTVPVWIMRQAGRYLPEYRRVREQAGSFLNLCKTPELAAEVTIQPIDRLGVDAAILFSDILIVPEAMGLPLDFQESKGPILERPVRDQAAVDVLAVPDPVETVPFVMETIRILRRELSGRVPLIGFSGAPFTLASYMVEGGSSKDFVTLKKFMYNQPKAMHSLLEKTARAVTAYMNAQIEAGAQAVQIFDSWAGVLSPRDYKEYALPYARQVIEGLNREGVPVIHFVADGSSLLPLIKSAGSDVVGVDWRIDLGEARSRLGTDVAVQGNLDPCALFSPPEEIERRVGEIIRAAGEAPGHIFNLGHGILPPTPPEHAQFMVEAVHRLGSRTG